MTIHRRFQIIAALLLVVVVIGAWLLIGERSSNATAPSYSLAKIERGAIVSSVSAIGTLGPVITVHVGSQVSGTIFHLYADFNSHVKKGDLVAQIDPSLYQTRLAEAEANLQSANAARDKAWVGVLDAKRQLERQQGLQKQNLVSESVVDAAKLAYETAVVEHKVKQALSDPSPGRPRS